MANASFHDGFAVEFDIDSLLDIVRMDFPYALQVTHGVLDDFLAAGAAHTFDFQMSQFGSHLYTLRFG